MAENFQLSPEDWLCILTLSTKYPQRVLLKACCEGYFYFFATLFSVNRLIPTSLHTQIRPALPSFNIAAVIK